MKIAIDAMGGDFAPSVIVKGALNAVKESNIEIILVGQDDLINQELAKYNDYDKSKISVLHAEEVITMEDIPSQALRRKRGSSMHVGLRLVKDNKADAFYSCGNTGAVMAIATVTLRTLDGIDRPAIATALPTIGGHTVLIDSGANVDSKPANYLQFAIMGSAYAKSILKKSSPVVKLLSIGEEDVKGNEVTRAVFSLLKGCSAISFVGNIEAKELYTGNADVIVCDGFMGNVALKTSEAVAIFVNVLLKEELSSGLMSKLGALLMMPALKRFKKRVDYEQYGGAPLLGVNGVCVIGHGSSSEISVKNAIKMASNMVKEDINTSIEEDVINSFKMLKDTDFAEMKEL